MADLQPSFKNRGAYPLPFKVKQQHGNKTSAKEDFRRYKARRAESGCLDLVRGEAGQ
jgi:hypothetical protein